MLCLEELKKFDVLLVEDEKNIADQMTDAIGNLFNSFEVTHDGESGLELYKKTSPDIVITDIMVPKLTGLKMAKEIRKIDNTPIIILSAHSDTQKLLEAIDIGVVKYFIKPFDPDEFLEYLCQLTKKISKNLEIALDDGFVFTDKLYKHNKLVPLSRNELKIFDVLAHRLGIPISHEEIKKVLWNNKNVSDERVRTLIRRLRAKTSKNLIKSISGQGYFISR